jgi:hypothetical protein
MDVKDIPTWSKGVAADIKDTTILNESLTDDSSHVPVKKDVDNAQLLEYNVVRDGATGMLMDIKNVKVDHVAQTECDHKLDLTVDVADTARPYPVLLVQVKQELDDVESICPQHHTALHSDIKLPGYFFYFFYFFISTKTHYTYI